MKKIGVIGHGLMGRGIIHTFAACGFTVIGVKRRENDRRFSDYLRNELEKGRITPKEHGEILSRVEVTSDIEKVADCRIVIECINEIIKYKTDLFAKLDKICSQETIFASNTSSIPIGKLGSCTNRHDRVIGLHFMSPTTIMKLVEIIESMETSDETLKTAIDITEAIGKTPVVVKDFPGFVSSRLGASIINEAIHILMQGVTDAKSVDQIAQLGLNLPMGPLRLADNIGLDVVLNTIDSLYRNYGDSKYRVPALLRVMVETGYLGKKTGRGFYSYG
ncbi:MAG: 3-hydroxybutyryl-CoA dehydrogenase [Clostridium sp.]|nr:3-hydroxybutyryl-CoA dehydrogenase [Clostridium sp.]